jgi:hypothetical protein
MISIVTLGPPCPLLLARHHAEAGPDDQRNPRPDPAIRDLADDQDAPEHRHGEGSEIPPEGLSRSIGRADAPCLKGPVGGVAAHDDGKPDPVRFRMHLLGITATPATVPGGNRPRIAPATRRCTSLSTGSTIGVTRRPYPHSANAHANAARADRVLTPTARP